MDIIFIAIHRCTIHIWGLMLPHASTSSHMATPPKDFLHIKEVVAGDGIKKTLEVREDGVALNTTEFQKFFGKKEAWPYAGYDHTVDMKYDVFLSSLGNTKKQKFNQKKKEIWKGKQEIWKNQEDFWYMLVEKEVGLYQDRDVFQSIRDANYKGDGKNWSRKGVWFDSLAGAKNYVQMARDEEGTWWAWPQVIPVYWMTGPLTRNNIEEVPGFKEDEEEEEEEEE